VSASTSTRPRTSTRDSSVRPAATLRRRGERFRPGSYLFLAMLGVYFIFPLYWLVIASTKSSSALFNGSGGSLWFDRRFSLFSNLGQLVTQGGGVFLQWVENSALYTLCGGVGSTVLAILAGWGFAKYRFKGSGLFFAVLLGSVMVPLTALVIPTFVLLHAMNLTNTIWAVILPSLLNPFGVYLMRVYSQDAVPDELMDAARVDGAGEIAAFFRVALPLLRPAIVTVLLLSMVGVWNNFFLPLTMLTSPDLFPLTVGLRNWAQQSSGSSSSVAGGQVMNLVTTGSLVSIIPLMVAFLGLQRYWQGGLSVGSLK
jgi:multiple sugar transport system permease protein